MAQSRICVVHVWRAGEKIAPLLLLALSLLMILCLNGYSNQPGRDFREEFLTGTVFDQDTGKGIPGAAVVFVNTKPLVNYTQLLEDAALAPFQRRDLLDWIKDKVKCQVVTTDRSGAFSISYKSLKRNTYLLLRPVYTSIF